LTCADGRFSITSQKREAFQVLLFGLGFCIVKVDHFHIGVWFSWLCCYVGAYGRVGGLCGVGQAQGDTNLPDLISIMDR
jgi:hypothetical protein